MKAIILFDLTFGDAGKGTLVDYLARAHGAHTVVRFNGGAQAAHTVVLPDGRWHTFSQFSSATFVPKLKTFLSRFMLFDPAALVGEERHLQSVGVSDAFSRLAVDADAPVVTPFHKAANRLREIARGAGRHGSCGMGIGETMADLVEDAGAILRVGDLLDGSVTRRKLRYFQEKKRAAVAGLVLPERGAPAETVARELGLLNDAGAVEEFTGLFGQVARRVEVVRSARAIFRRERTIVLEGAQGVLLDEWYGFHPHTTWSTTTPENARTLLRENGFSGEVRTIGALRAYMTRHGSGPFPTEDAAFTATLADVHNPTNPWQQQFRTGPLDLVLLRYALDVARKAGAVDALAVTCLDRVGGLKRVPVCTGYEGMAAELYEADLRVGTRLKVSKAPDLVHQERLTGALFGARPRVEGVLPLHLLPWVEDRLSTPVRVVSFGATHMEKAERPRSGVRKEGWEVRRRSA
jgi:adenylosuccinate synthase